MFFCVWGGVLKDLTGSYLAASNMLQAMSSELQSAVKAMLSWSYGTREHFANVPREKGLIRKYLFFCCCRLAYELRFSKQLFLDAFIEYC